MMTRPPKRPRDTNQLAKMVVEMATGDEHDAPSKKVVPGNSTGGKNVLVCSQKPSGGQSQKKALVHAGEKIVLFGRRQNSHSVLIDEAGAKARA